MSITGQETGTFHSRFTHTDNYYPYENSVMNYQTSTFIELLTKETEGHHSTEINPGHVNG